MRGVVPSVLVVASSVQAALVPIFFGRTASQPVFPLTISQVASFNPYTHFASAAYCHPTRIESWSCGVSCDANKHFKVVSAGGDGFGIPYYFVGYDPILKSVIVSHQGTDIFKIVPVLTDITLLQAPLNPKLFPGLPHSINVHIGFREVQELSAPFILEGVQTALSRFNATQVTVVGHSLGGALALLDAVYLQLHLPSSISISSVVYGTPRVGNNAFADHVDAHIHNLIRINNKGDPVPDLPSALGLPLPLFTYRHPSGEVHILGDDSWVGCPGQENFDGRCTAGGTNVVRLVADLVRGVVTGTALRVAGHNGLYDGVSMGAGC